MVYTLVSDTVLFFGQFLKGINKPLYHEKFQSYWFETAENRSDSNVYPIEVFGVKNESKNPINVSFLVKF